MTPFSPRRPPGPRICSPTNCRRSSCGVCASDGAACDSRATSPTPCAPVCGRVSPCGCCCRSPISPRPTPTRCMPARATSAGRSTSTRRLTFAVDAVGRTEALGHTHFTALKVKDAVVDVLRDRRGARPSVNVDDPDVRIVAHLANGRAHLALDLAGEPLFKRGWRLAQTEATLKETLAAAILRACGYDGTRPLIDPMCGSGTLAVEAGLIAQHHAPGVHRKLGIERWASFDETPAGRAPAPARRGPAGRAPGRAAGHRGRPRSRGGPRDPGQRQACGLADRGAAGGRARPRTPRPARGSWSSTRPGGSVSTGEDAGSSRRSSGNSARRGANCTVTAWRCSPVGRSSRAPSALARNPGGCSGTARSAACCSSTISTDAVRKGEAVFSRRTAWQVTPNRIAAALEEYRRSGRPCLDLTETNPTRVGLPMPAGEIREALADARGLRYEPTPFGHAEARAAVAAYHGGAVAPERVVLTASTSEAYALLFKLLGDPGDRVLAPVPSYPLFEYLAGLESLEVVPYPSPVGRRWLVHRPVRAGRAHRRPDPGDPGGQPEQSHGGGHPARGGRPGAGAVPGARPGAHQRRGLRGSCVHAMRPRACGRSPDGARRWSSS